MKKTYLLSPQDRALEREIARHMERQAQWRQTLQKAPRAVLLGQGLPRFLIESGAAARVRAPQANPARMWIARLNAL